MARSKGTIVSVKVPINWECMTNRQRTRLDSITSRDTRVIKAYLRIIERHKNALVMGSKYKRINFVLLDKLTLTALRARNPSNRRPKVPHDFKSRFRNISVNELQECRDIAINMWNSYLERGGSPPLKSSFGRLKKIPRNIYPKLFKIIHRPDLKIKHWLELRDSLDSARQHRARHDKVTVPLKMSPFHINQLWRGEIKSCRISKDSSGKWWGTFAVMIYCKPSGSSAKKPMAVMGVDLGISKAACAVVLTQDGVHHVRYFHQHGKNKSLTRYERRVGSLQREMRIRQNTGLPYDKISKKLRGISHKRTTVKEEWDKVLANEIISYAVGLTSKYDLYVGVGNPKGIRNIATRAFISKSRKYRGMIHGWAFSRILASIQHGFSQLGWTTGKLGSRFLGVYEGKTSITCAKCGRKGIRPKQSLFICHSCGHRTNADKNGAINIARRMIRLTPDLRDEHKGLGRWLYPSRRRPSSKAARRGKRSSKRKSQLSKRSSALLEGESAAVRFVQKDLCISGDRSTLNDQDPAVENAAEKPPVTRCLDSPRTDVSGLEKQRIETTFRRRSHALMKSDKTRATLKHLGGTEVSDDSHELGGTQKLQDDCEFHSLTGERKSIP